MIEIISSILWFSYIAMIVLLTSLRADLEVYKAQIHRMRVWQKNQEDREKQLLERIKFLETNQK